jgi:hypothetical protein
VTDLGPTGRTKHTEDDPYSHYGILSQDPEEYAKRLEQAERNAENMRLAKRLLLWSLTIALGGLLAWFAYGLVATMMKAPERERRIDACATAMSSESARESTEVPIPQCRSLSVSERREAAYVYAKREGLL